MGDLSRINTNVAALRAQLNLSSVNERILEQQAKISSGKNVNKASDGPANYFISKQLEKDISGLVRQQKNVERGINFLETQDAKFAQIVNILLDMVDLAQQANSVAVSSAEKIAIQQQIEQFRQEIDQVLLSGISQTLFSGFQLGGLENVKLTGTGPISATTIGLIASNISVTGSSNVNAAIANLNSALDSVLQWEQTLASFVQRLEFEMESFQVEEVNQRATLSTIIDADLAAEQVELTKLQILQQSTLVMLAQANSAPSAVLSLFQ